MAARAPEDCDMKLMEAINRGDLEAAVALYEPDAVLVTDPSGTSLVGRDAIRDYLRAALVAGMRMTRETRSLRNGDVALTGGPWKLGGHDGDGNRVELEGDSREVVRRQADGTWRFAIDDPWGAASRR